MSKSWFIVAGFILAQTSFGATRSLVPNSNGEGGLGTTDKRWGQVYANDVTITDDLVVGDSLTVDGIDFGTLVSNIADSASAMSDGSGVTDAVAWRAAIGASRAITNEYTITGLASGVRDFDFDDDLLGEWVPCSYLGSPDYSLAAFGGGRFMWGWRFQTGNTRVMFDLPCDATKIRLTGWCDTNGMTSVDGFRLLPNAAYITTAGTTVSSGTPITVPATSSIFMVTNTLNGAVLYAKVRQAQAYEYTSGHTGGVTNRVEWWLLGMEAYVPKTEAKVLGSLIKDASDDW